MDEGYKGSVPFDPRFPNQNQTKHCFVSYRDYYRCIALFDEGHEPCKYFQRVFTTICPNEWISKWDDQRENGTFPDGGKIPKRD